MILVTKLKCKLNLKTQTPKTSQPLLELLHVLVKGTECYLQLKTNHTQLKSTLSHKTETIRAPYSAAVCCLINRKYSRGRREKREKRKPYSCNCFYKWRNNCVFPFLLCGKSDAIGTQSQYNKMAAIDASPGASSSPAFTSLCTHRQPRRRPARQIYDAPESINVSFLCVHLAQWPLCSPHLIQMLLGTVGDTFADSGALMRKEEWRCYVTGSGLETDGRTEFLRAFLRKHILECSWTSRRSPTATGGNTTSDGYASERVGEPTRLRQRYGGAHIF